MTDANPPRIKRVVLCADDFAVHGPASHGIVRLAAMGRLSATSAMVLSPRWPQDVALLHELRGQMDVGLHLDWTSDFALDAGHGVSLGSAMIKGLLGGFDRKLARTVIERQLDAFESQWKASPDFVDGHQHVHQFAGIRVALVQVLRTRYGGTGPYLRLSRAPAGRADLKSRIVAVMGAGALEFIAKRAHLTVACALSGMYNFAGNQAQYAQRMRGWLQAAPEGSIIMCHPAQSQHDMDAIGAARVREYEYLGSPEFGDALAAAGVALARFSNTRTGRAGHE